MNTLDPCKDVGSYILTHWKAGGKTGQKRLNSRFFSGDVLDNAVLYCVSRFLCFNSFLIDMMQSTHSCLGPVAKAWVGRGALGAVSVRAEERPWRRCASSRSISMVCFWRLRESAPPRRGCWCAWERYRGGSGTADTLVDGGWGGGSLPPDVLFVKWYNCILNFLGT